MSSIETPKPARRRSSPKAIPVVDAASALPKVCPAPVSAKASRLAWTAARAQYATEADWLKSPERPASQNCHWFWFWLCIFAPERLQHSDLRFALLEQMPLSEQKRRRFV